MYAPTPIERASHPRAPWFIRLARRLSGRARLRGLSGTTVVGTRTDGIAPIRDPASRRTGSEHRRRRLHLRVVARARHTPGARVVVFGDAVGEFFHGGLSSRAFLLGVGGGFFASGGFGQREFRRGERDVDHGGGAELVAELLGGVRGDEGEEFGAAPRCGRI